MTLGTLLAAPAHAQLPGDKATAIVSYIETNFKPKNLTAPTDLKSLYRKAGPFIEVMDLQKFETFRQNKCNAIPKDKRDPSKCPRFEWYTPFWLVDVKDPARDGVQASQEVARKLKMEWQRFQDRLHWFVVASINNRLDFRLKAPPWHNIAPNCAFPDIGDTLVDAVRTVDPLGNTERIENIPTPDLQISTPNVVFDNAQIPNNGKFPFVDIKPSVDLPFKIYPRTHTADNCEHYDGLFADSGNGVDVPFMYIPRHRECVWYVCVDEGLVGTIIGGITGNNYPQPLYLNINRTKSRMVEACNKMMQEEYPEYLANVAKILAEAMPLAIHWDGLASFDGLKSGVIFQPVASYTPQPTQIAELAANSENKNALPYYIDKTLPRLNTDLDVRLQKRAGEWRLEELKRWLKPATVLENERFGYVTLFQVWNEIETVVDARPNIYHYHSILCNAFPPFSSECHDEEQMWWMPNLVATPAGCHIDGGNDGPGTTILTGVQRFYWKWVNVPEGGYQIPNTKNSPINP
ncbi:hypothetical protein [Deinococcus roseus]|uniref:Uncharacterized protein n=1 Tax=Deinococcus roseus TaxID=392414 RepID=A0ABQ2D921_9DEIO|nr:hypothetical protein [Deinococcus roseus]GGJ48111.1 hypothetical protein GCM10008938_37650 [Deinococcus roseus]